MSELFQPIEPYKIHHINVDSIHTLYAEESGNPTGLPIVFLHGGPGSGTNENFRRLFDPAIYRIILFDQRGAGRSTPRGELKNNMTSFLLDDIETIRRYLQIEQWYLLGESWGTTLALLYAEKFPKQVLGLILRGTLLGRNRDIEWFYSSDGANRFQPEAWHALLAFLPQAEQHDVLQSYYKRIIHHDREAVKAFTLYNKAFSSLSRTNLTSSDLDTDIENLSLRARIEAHYYSHHFFLTPNYILKHIHEIQDIPGMIIHGRYDLCTTVDNAYDLHHAWPKSELYIVPNAGHSVLEPGYFAALINATQKICDMK